MKQIGIVSASPGAGAKTIAALLACYLADKKEKEPAVLELGTGGLFNSLGLDKRFAGKEFYAPGGPPNRLWGVNWQVQSDGKTSQQTKGEMSRMETARDFSEEETPNHPEHGSNLYRYAKMMRAAEGDVLLCILNGLTWKEQKTLLEDMNAVLPVLDPLPSVLLALPHENPEFYRFFFGSPFKPDQDQSGARFVTAGNSRCIPVINKMNEGVKRYQIENYLGISNPAEMPLLDVASLYRAEYVCKPPYLFANIRKTAEAALADLWNRIS